MNADDLRAVHSHHIAHLEADIRDWTRRLPHFVDREKTLRDIEHARAEIAGHKALGGIA